MNFLLRWPHSPATWGLSPELPLRSWRPMTFALFLRTSSDTQGHFSERGAARGLERDEQSGEIWADGAGRYAEAGCPAEILSEKPEEFLEIQNMIEKILDCIIK